MFSILLGNLRLFGILALMFLGSLGANTLLGIFYNIRSIGCQFSKKKLLDGLLRGGVLLAATVLIVVIVSVLPELLTSLDIAVPGEIVESLSMFAIAGVIISATIRYLQDALKKFYAILNGRLVEGDTVSCDADQEIENNEDEIEDENEDIDGEM